MDKLKNQALADMNELGRQEEEITAALHSARAEYKAAKQRRNEVERSYDLKIRDIEIKQKIAADAYQRACSGEQGATYQRITKNPSLEFDRTMQGQTEGRRKSDPEKRSATVNADTFASVTRDDNNATQATTQANEYKPYTYIEKTPTVLLTRDGVWVELRCPVCKGNVTGNSTFFRGFKGVHDHVRRSHDRIDLVSLSKDEFIEACKYRVVNAETVEAYQQAGEFDVLENPIEAVPCARAPKRIESVDEDGPEDTDKPNARPAKEAPAKSMTTRPDSSEPRTARRTAPPKYESSSPLADNHRKRTMSEDSSDSSPLQPTRRFRDSHGRVIRVSNPV